MAINITHLMLTVITTELENLETGVAVRFFLGLPVSRATQKTL